MTIKSIAFEPAHKRVTFTGNKTVLEIASENGVPIDQPCRGNGTCGKCKITVAPSTDPSIQEKQLLTHAELNANIRLACQTQALDNMCICLENSEAARIQTLGIAEQVPESDIMPEVTADNVKEKFDADANGGIYGIALDIGTTTLAASLVNLQTGATEAVAAGLNPQTAYGDDVISRISYAAKSLENLLRLQACVIDAVNGLIAELLEKSAVDPLRIFHFIAAGNATMEHLFVGEDVSSIGVAPFAPKFYKIPRKRAAELALQINPAAYVDLMPNISGHVGGDVTAGIYFTGLYRQEAQSLLIDLGTNSEMALGGSNGILACSAAAGPAFEGARIHRGMRAEPGAIDEVRIREDGTIEIATINGRQPRGFCGSGLIDLVAALREAEIIEASGAFAKKDIDSDRFRRLNERIRKSDFGREIVIAEGEHGPITLTQRDIREVQLAKGAIASGIEMLLAKQALTPDEIDSVYLAGAFGNYLDKNSATRLGILPKVDASKIIAAGNTAGKGCIKALLSNDCWEEIDAFLKSTTHLELAASGHFQERFVANMAFE